MKWINMPRQCGKTTMLIHAAYVTGTPIVVYSLGRKMCVLDMAKKMGLDVDVYTADEWRIKNRTNNKPNRVVIDEAQDFIEEALKRQLNAEIVAVTMTMPYIERSDNNVTQI